jgi:hypothetical protein
MDNGFKRIELFKRINRNVQVECPLGSEIGEAWRLRSEIMQVLFDKNELLLCLKKLVLSPKEIICQQHRFDKNFPLQSYIWIERQYQFSPNEMQVRSRLHQVSKFRIK